MLHGAVDAGIPTLQGLDLRKYLPPQEFAKLEAVWAEIEEETTSPSGEKDAATSAMRKIQAAREVLAQSDITATYIGTTADILAALARQVWMHWAVAEVEDGVDKSGKPKWKRVWESAAEMRQEQIEVLEAINRGRMELESVPFGGSSGPSTGAKAGTSAGSSPGSGDAVLSTSG